MSHLLRRPHLGPYSCTNPLSTRSLSRTDFGLHQFFDSHPNRSSPHRVFTGRLSVLLDRLVRRDRTTLVLFPLTLLSRLVPSRSGVEYCDGLSPAARAGIGLAFCNYLLLSPRRWPLADYAAPTMLTLQSSSFSPSYSACWVIAGAELIGPT